MAGRGSLVAVMALLLVSNASAKERHPGSAVVTVGESEYTISIECYVSGNAAQGFSTEPGRLVRERTGRSNGVRLTVRPWKNPEYFVISLDRYVAWVPAPAPTSGVLEMILDMSPASTPVNGMPEALTFERWMEGDRPEGLSGVRFVADCTRRDPAAPAYRKVPVIAG